MVPGNSGPTLKLPFRILVLDDDDAALWGIVDLLRDADYLVTGAATYDAAKRLLGVGSYDLFITDVRLRGYNGINLVRQCRVEHPDMSVMIITGYDESMMELEAARYGALFSKKPIRPQEFLSSVSRCLANVRRQRRWARRRIAGGFRVLANGVPAAVVDVSYGGLRMEVPHGAPLPRQFAVEIAAIGLHLPVEAVWKTRSDDGTLEVCGAALAADGTSAARTWRAIVDRMSA